MDKDTTNNHQDANEEKDASKHHPKAAFEFALNAKAKGEDSLESPRPTPPSPGDRLQYVGDYKIKSEISSGAMGVVFLAIQQSLKREVALKMIHPSLTRNKNLRQRFRIEAEAVASLDHPNIVPIYEVGEHNGQPYFTMRYLSGGNLAQAFASSYGLSSKDRIKKIAVMVSTVASAVHHAHQRGILHRDLKPSNVLLDEHGIPAITDFGLAKFAEKETTLTRSQSTLGTPAYMSPEQAGGRSREISVASDVYSLGAILYELLVGRSPFTGESHLEIMRKVRDEAPPALRSINADVDTDLEIICLKALNKLPRMRYASARDLADDLNRWSKGEAIHARRVTALEHFQMWVFRHPGWAAALCCLMIISVGLPLLTWQVNEARMAEKAEKDKAADLLVRSRLDKAEQLLANGDSGQALAYLTSILRLEPDNNAVAEKLIYLLTYRNWIKPQSLVDFGENIPDSTVWSANGQFLAGLMPNEETVQLWDVLQGNSKVLAHDMESVKHLEISPNSNLLVIGNSRSCVVLALPTCNQLATLPDTKDVRDLFFNPDSTHLFLNTTNSIWVFDCSDLSRTPHQMDTGNLIRELEFHPNKPELVLLSGNQIQTWNYRTGQKQFETRTKRRNVAYWRSGEWILSFNGDARRSTQPVYRPLANSSLYDATTGKLFAQCNELEQWELEASVTLPEHYPNLADLPYWEQWSGFVHYRPFSRPLRAFRFKQPTWGGRRILDSQPRASGISSQRERRDQFKHIPTDHTYFSKEESKLFALSAYGHRLRVQDENTDRFQIWDTIQLQPILEPHMGLFDRSSLDGRHFLNSGDRNSWEVWNAAERGGLPDRPASLFHVEKANFTKDGQQIFSIDSQGLLRVHSSSDLSLISNPEKPLTLRRFAGSGTMTWLELLDGMDVIAVGTRNRSLQLWNGNTAEKLSEVIMLPGKLLDLKWLPNRQRLVIQFQYGVPSTVWVWDLASSSELPMPMGDLGQALPCLATDSSGSFLLLRTASDETRLWNSAAGQWHAPAIKMPAPFSNNPKDAAYSAGFSKHNGRYFIRTGADIQIRDLNDADYLKTITEPIFGRVSPQKIEWIDQGDSLLIASGRAFAVYDLEHENPRFPLVKTDPFHLIYASPDGRRIITASSSLPSESKVTAWSSRDGSMLGIPYSHTGALNDIQLDQKGKRALLIADKEIVLWDTETQIVLYRIPLPDLEYATLSRIRRTLPTASLSPDGTSILLTHVMSGSQMAMLRLPAMGNMALGGVDRMISLAEAVGQYRLSEDGSLRRTEPHSFFEIKNKVSDELSWEHWFTSSAKERSRSPWSKQDSSMPQQESTGIHKLQDCLDIIRRDPNYDPAWERLGQIIPESLMGSLNKPWLLEYAGDLLRSIKAVLVAERLSVEMRLHHAKEIKRFETDGGDLSGLSSVGIEGTMDRLLSNWLTDAFFGQLVLKPSTELLLEVIDFMEDQLRYKADRRLVQLAIKELEASDSPEPTALERLQRIQQRQNANQKTSPQLELNKPEAPSSISIPPEAIGEDFSYSVKLKIGFNAVASHLVIGKNRLSDLFPTAISGTTLFTWNGSEFDAANYALIPGALEGWQPSDRIIPPGSAVMLDAKYPVTISFSGKKLKAPLPRPLQPGLHLLANQMPVESGFEEIVGRSPLHGETMMPKIPLGAGEEDYETYTYTEKGWEPEELRLPIGDGAFFELIAPSPLPESIE